MRPPLSVGGTQNRTPMPFVQRGYGSTWLCTLIRVCTQFTCGVEPLILATLVAFCGMVGLRAMVLGRLGRTSSPHPRACALSCPSPAVYGPGAPGHLNRPAWCYEGTFSCCRSSHRALAANSLRAADGAAGCLHQRLPNRRVGAQVSLEQVTSEVARTGWPAHNHLRSVCNAAQAARFGHGGLGTEGRSRVSLAVKCQRYLKVMQANKAPRIFPGAAPRNVLRNDQGTTVL
jgi:hypothetical protein